MNYKEIQRITKDYSGLLRITKEALKIKMNYKQLKNGWSKKPSNKISIHFNIMMKKMNYKLQKNGWNKKPDPYTIKHNN